MAALARTISQRMRKIANAADDLDAEKAFLLALGPEQRVRRT